MGDRPRPIAPAAEAAWRAFFDLCQRAAQVPGDDPAELRAALAPAERPESVRGLVRPGDPLAELAVRGALLHAELFAAGHTPGVRLSFAEALDASARLAWRMTCGGQPEEFRHPSLGKDR